MKIFTFAAFQTDVEDVEIWDNNTSTYHSLVNDRLNKRNLKRTAASDAVTSGCVAPQFQYKIKTVAGVTALTFWPHQLPLAAIDCSRVNIPFMGDIFSMLAPGEKNPLEVGITRR